MTDELWIDLLLVLALSLVLSLLAYRMDLLTKSGCIAAFMVGSITGACGSLYWLILLIVFTLAGFAATLAGISKKKEKGLQEGTHGERTYRNVLGVAAPCCLFAIVNLLTQDQYYYWMMIGYIGTISVAAADTAGSEIGTKDPNVYLITTFKKVPVGTDGGISRLGTAVSLLAAAIVTIIGWAVINLGINDIRIIAPIIGGFAGCLLDSLVGATMETKRYVNKYSNNCITGILGALIAILIAHLI